MLKAVDEWEAELRRVEAEHDRLRRQTDERDARLEEANDLELRAKQLERRLETLNEQRDRQTTSAQEKRDTVRRRMERVENAHKALMREQAVADAEAGKRHKAITMKEKEARRFFFALRAG